MKREVVEKTYSRSVEDDSNIALAPHDYEQLVQRLQARQRAVRHRDWSSARAIRDELDAVAARCGCRLVLDDDACTFRFSTKPAREPRKGVRRMKTRTTTKGRRTAATATTSRPSTPS